MSDVLTTRIDWLDERFREQVTTQSYASSPPIDGVRTVDLRLFSDEAGDFCELARFREGGMLEGLPDFRIAQVNWSLMEPGAIKAWHLHERQDDVWFVPPSDRLLVGLLDVRRDSPTRGRVMRFVLGAGRVRVVFIPRGVAHGAANLGASAASIVYLINNTFNAQEPDEHRLPYDVLGAEFWAMQPG